MSETILIAVGAAGFLLAGIGIGFLVARLAGNRQAEKAEEVQQKFDAYRRDVTEHFGRTAKHFQSIGEQYRELYEHMASGADSFCDRDAMEEKLPFEPAAALATDAKAQAAGEPEAPPDYEEAETPAEGVEGARASTAADEAVLAEAGEPDDETPQAEEPTTEVTPDAEEKEPRPTLH